MKKFKFRMLANTMLFFVVLNSVDSKAEVVKKILEPKLVFASAMQIARENFSSPSLIQINSFTVKEQDATKQCSQFGWQFVFADWNTLKSSIVEITSEKNVSGSCDIHFAFSKTENPPPLGFLNWTDKTVRNFQQSIENALEIAQKAVAAPLHLDSISINVPVDGQHFEEAVIDLTSELSPGKGAKVIVNSRTGKVELVEFIGK